MGRGHKHKARDKNSATLPQTPKNLKRDGVDEEFSREIADQADMEAQARANAANQRQQTNRKRK
ncbi:YfhD family protein [Metabacillus bambusae]|uniref:YfhD family protein n=1 Tax=Metabacillus bambusae TaxID=2795218 RepID=A0ABS3NBY7_9BACI|nr:YfhD family protein [Metabacillus bambusae]MBO1515575.1 YfhD family protein [Metabacillus bambusae]